MSHRIGTCIGVAFATVVLASTGCDYSKPTSPTLRSGQFPAATPGPTAGPTPAPAPGPTPGTTPAAVNYSLSGVVFEATPGGRAPVADATVQVQVCPPNSDFKSTVTDDAGHYSVSGVCAIPHTGYVWVLKPGYTTKPPKPCDGDCLPVQVDGVDTHFDAELFRQ